MATNHPNISDAEWTVMRAVWKKGDATSAEIVDAISSKNDWKPRTVRTLISRLVKKGALTYREHGREYIYRSLIDEKASKMTASTSFLDRVFGGNLAPFLANFTESGAYSDEDIAELKRIVEQHSANGNNDDNN